MPPARAALQTVDKPNFEIQVVGASIARPSKNVVFRISRREIAVFSPCGDRFCFCKICGRPMVAPTIDYFDTLKCRPQGRHCFLCKDSDRVSGQDAFPGLLSVLIGQSELQRPAIPEANSEDLIVIRRRPACDHIRDVAPTVYPSVHTKHTMRDALGIKTNIPCFNIQQDHQNHNHKRSAQKYHHKQQLPKQN